MVITWSIFWYSDCFHRNGPNACIFGHESQQIPIKHVWSVCHTTNYLPILLAQGIQGNISPQSKLLQLWTNIFQYCPCALLVRSNIFFLHRSTEEIFALFISLAFTVDAISSIIKGTDNDYPEKTQIVICHSRLVEVSLWTHLHIYTCENVVVVYLQVLRTKLCYKSHRHTHKSRCFNNNFDKDQNNLPLVCFTDFCLCFNFSLPILADRDCFKNFT